MRGVGAQIPLDFRNTVLGVAQVRDQQGQCGVHAGLGGGGVGRLGEPAALDLGGEEGRVDGAVGAWGVVRVSLHHPFSPQLGKNTVQ